MKINALIIISSLIVLSSAGLRGHGGLTDFCQKSVNQIQDLYFQFINDHNEKDREFIAAKMKELVSTYEARCQTLDHTQITCENVREQVKSLIRQATSNRGGLQGAQRNRQLIKQVQAQYGNKCGPKDEINAPYGFICDVFADYLRGRALEFIGVDTDRAAQDLYNKNRSSFELFVELCPYSDKPISRV
eukprot:TRINITY_DN281_c0_g1_i3.p1 TRINITY_DN281_c0_g1~~TRINITY_DN281_c0_g1_i3.p1  ORF type:complete len:189 (-),score=33.89 TRINITY_DN281_c0_g1_i3:306-872(-)